MKQKTDELESPSNERLRLRAKTWTPGDSTPHPCLTLLCTAIYAE